MYCKKCGEKIADDSIFCSVCGAKVVNNEVAPVKEEPTEREDRQGKVIVTSLSEKWVWALATVPMIVSMLLDYTGWLAGLSFLSWIIVAGMNYGFISLDSRELMRFGIDTEGYGFAGIILVPLYIIVREVKTNRNLVPAVLWLFLLAVDIFIL